MPDISTVLYDVLIPVGDEKSLRLYFDLSTTITKANQYADEFTTIRGLPFDLDNISAKDPVLMYCVSHYAPQMKAGLISQEAILHRVQQYYTQARAEAQKDAMMVAMFNHPDNLELLNREPEPYPPESKGDEDPLVLTMPTIAKNLVYPTERRLKVLTDLLISTGAILQVTNLLNTLSVRINVFAQELIETDDSGFPDGSSGDAVHAEVLATGRKQKVQKAGANT